MNHAPGAGSLARPVDQQASAIPLYPGCPLISTPDIIIVTNAANFDFDTDVLINKYFDYFHKM